MLLRQLEYLVALARERHFARAAEACHVSQPSLSAAISKLERELGVPIVSRSRRFESLTPEGERVLLWAHRMLADRDALQQDLSRMRESLSGVLRIGAIPTALPAAPLLTAPFCERHPHVRVTLESLSSREIERRLDEFELDIAMTYVDGSVRAMPLYEERYVLLTPADEEIASRPVARWADVAALPLCLLTSKMRNRRILDGIFADAGVQPVPVIEADTVATLYAHVATRKWSSVIAHAWLQMFGTPEGMRVVRIEDPRRVPQIGLVTGEQVSMLARAMLGLTRGLDVRGELDRMLHKHLDRREL
ncbi:LysR family transcriptional regulator [Lentzea sp. PSKA42]|uniref:LysR family transcriptional regulator n=1 Tax=Lentzea indica TaxID=2604800 RepID=A0ABX1FLB3_9PSEU|nr:LysR substrate-binding domain-containing protein [Lentzea indica]NKE59540.1 LysR family transcriptional regulator [Lentzea indica]